MDSIEYLGPAGQTQHTDSAVVAARLRAAGWRPRSELEELAPFRPEAAEQLHRATEAAAERKRREQQRRADTEPLPPGTEETGSAGDSPQPATGDAGTSAPPRKRGSKTT